MLRKQGSIVKGIWDMLHTLASLLPGERLLPYERPWLIFCGNFFSLNKHNLVQPSVSQTYLNTSKPFKHIKPIEISGNWCFIEMCFGDLIDSDHELLGEGLCFSYIYSPSAWHTVMMDSSGD